MNRKEARDNALRYSVLLQPERDPSKVYALSMNAEVMERARMFEKYLMLEDLRVNQEVDA